MVWFTNFNAIGLVVVILLLEPLDAFFYGELAHLVLGIDVFRGSCGLSMLLAVDRVVIIPHVDELARLLHHLIHITLTLILLI